MYGTRDLRLEEFELPQIKDDEILVKIMSDSICMSTYKLVEQGKNHKRAPKNIDTNPVIIGHEFSGVIVEVGEKWKDQFKPGMKFAQQPALNYKGSLASPGYSYEFFGGACTYCIIPHEVMELGCLMPYDGSFFEASLGEPMSCCIGGYHGNYHTNKRNHDLKTGVKEDGYVLVAGGCGPMGLGMISYGIQLEDHPKKIVVTDIDDAKLARAEEVISVEQAAKNGWSRNVLVHQIESGLYQRQALAEKVSNFELRLPSPQSELAIQTMKDPYIFDFIPFKTDMLEREIEEALVKDVTKLLLELGTGFAFLGNQYHLNVGGDDFYIDLLFYNLNLRCYVVIELKTGEFKPEYAGQLNFYLSAVDGILKKEQDNPSVGLLLCKSKNDLVAEYSLKDMSKPIGVSAYQVTSKLPEELEKQLPSVEDIQKRIK